MDYCAKRLRNLLCLLLVGAVAVAAKEASGVQAMKVGDRSEFQLMGLVLFFCAC